MFRNILGVQTTLWSTLQVVVPSSVSANAYDCCAGVTARFAPKLSEIVTFGLYGTDDELAFATSNVACIVYCVCGSRPKNPM